MTWDLTVVLGERLIFDGFTLVGIRDRDYLYFKGSLVIGKKASKIRVKSWKRYARLYLVKKAANGSNVQS